MWRPKPPRRRSPKRCKAWSKYYPKSPHAQSFSHGFQINPTNKYIYLKISKNQDLWNKNQIHNYFYPCHFCFPTEKETPNDWFPTTSSHVSLLSFAHAPKSGSMPCTFDGSLCLAIEVLGKQVRDTSGTDFVLKICRDVSNFGSLSSIKEFQYRFQGFPMPWVPNTETNPSMSSGSEKHEEPRGAQH